MAHAVAQSHPFEHFLRQTEAFRRSRSAVEQRKLHIVDHIQRADQMERLEDKPQRPVAELCQPAVAHGRGDHIPVQLQRSARRSIQQADDIQQRRLAAARRPHHAEKFSLFHFQVHILQSLGFNLIHPVDLIDPGQSDYCHIAFVF